METVTRNVRDLDPATRSTLERVIGHELRDSQQIVVQVGEPAKLPDWCNVYEGMTDEQIDEVDHEIRRLHTTRDVH